MQGFHCTATAAAATTTTTTTPPPPPAAPPPPSIVLVMPNIVYHASPYDVARAINCGLRSFSQIWNITGHVDGMNVHSSVHITGLNL